MAKINYQDLIGRTFGRLTVIGVGSKSFYDVKSVKGCLKRWNQKLLCLCECGNEKEIFYNSLQTSATQSCGCYQREMGGRDRVLSNQEFGTNGFFHDYKQSASNKK